MRMPGIDGFALLNATKDSYPRLFRIALSGQSEMEAKVRYTGLAHHYLAKPCVVNELTSAVKQLLAAPPADGL
jgi:CheY-like chemotaxis protein